MAAGDEYGHQEIEDHFRAHDLPEEVRQKFLVIKQNYETFAHGLVDATPKCPHRRRAIELLMQSKDAACMALIVTHVQGEREPG